MEQLGRKLGYHQSEVVEANGLAGGLVFFWKDEIHIEWQWSIEQVICLKYLREKQTFWEGMEHITNQFMEPWILFRDLNEVVIESKKWGGRIIWKRTLYLKHYIYQVGGIDLGFFSSKFTWQNKNAGSAFIRERLDRAVASHRWLQENPNSSVQH